VNSLISTSLSSKVRDRVCSTQEEIILSRSISQNDDLGRPGLDQGYLSNYSSMNSITDTKSPLPGFLTNIKLTANDEKSVELEKKFDNDIIKDKRTPSDDFGQKVSSSISPYLKKKYKSNGNIERFSIIVNNEKNEVSNALEGYFSRMSSIDNEEQGGNNKNDKSTSRMTMSSLMMRSLVLPKSVEKEPTENLNKKGYLDSSTKAVGQSIGSFNSPQSSRRIILSNKKIAEFNVSSKPEEKTTKSQSLYQEVRSSPHGSNLLKQGTEVQKSKVNPNPAKK
jgi:hypothetical protein